MTPKPPSSTCCFPVSLTLNPFQWLLHETEEKRGMLAKKHGQGCVCGLVWEGECITPLCLCGQGKRKCLVPWIESFPRTQGTYGIESSAMTNSLHLWATEAPSLCPSQGHWHTLLPDGVLPRRHLQRPLSARLGAQPEAGHICCHEQSLVQNSQCGFQGCGPRRLWETW